MRGPALNDALAISAASEEEEQIVDCNPLTAIGVIGSTAACELHVVLPMGLAASFEHQGRARLHLNM